MLFTWTLVSGRECVVQFFNVVPRCAFSRSLIELQDGVFRSMSMVQCAFIIYLGNRTH